MNRGAAAILVLAMTLGARAQDDKKAAGGDKIGKDKPPVVASKFLAEVQKRKSAAIAVVSQVGDQQQAQVKFDGILRKDFAAVKGGAEVYANKAVYLVNTGARFDPPEELQGQEGMQASAFKNPSLYFPELQKITASATFGGDEVVDGKDCIVVDFVASPELIKQYIKELSDRFDRRRGPDTGGFGGRGGMFNVAGMIDEKKTVATFRTCIGKADLFLYKLEFVMRPEMKPNSAPTPQIRIPPLNQKTEVKYSKWDEEVAFDVPGFIKTKWGVK